MAGVPQNFQAFSNVLANYNFVDIASGTGYVNFYAGNTVDLKLLSNFSYYSHTVTESLSGDGTLDVDFDTLLNRPLDVLGKGIVNVGIYLDSGTNNNGVTTVIPTIYLRKWDGVTETDIVSNVGTTITIPANTLLQTYSYQAIDLDIPLTHFKKGETLRITVKLVLDGGPNGTWTTSFGCDPMNRTSGWDGTGVVPSKLMFQCPVRLNL